MDEMVTTPVGLTLLRTLLPDLPLAQGTVLPGRVLERDGDRGLLMLAGARVKAQLPHDVQPGDVLRLRVQESSAEKLVLKVVDGPQVEQQQALPSAAAMTAAGMVGLPGGATARLFVEPDGGETAGRREAAPRSVLVRYESPALGRIDVKIVLSSTAVGATVQVSAGEPAGAVRAAAGELQDALASAASRPAQVRVLARDETVDLRA
jgi:hypothetical protein